MHISLAGKQAVYRQVDDHGDAVNINERTRTRCAFRYHHHTITHEPTERNFSLNGLSYQVVRDPLHGGVNINAAYDNMVVVPMGRTGRKHVSTSTRPAGGCSLYLYFSQLVNALVEAGENEKALTALDKVTGIVPDSTVRYGSDGVMFAQAYYRLGEEEKAKALIETIKGRLDANLNWFTRLRPAQLSNTMSDVIYNNITPMMLITRLYQQHDKENYITITDELLQHAYRFYTAGVPYLGDQILREITNGSLQGYYSLEPNDTIGRATEESVMQKSLGMMQQFSPRLMEQYSGSAE